MIVKIELVKELEKWVVTDYMIRPVVELMTS